MSVTTSAEILRYRATKFENFGREFKISRASVHRFINIFIEESKAFIPGESLPVYRGVPLWFSVLVLVLSFSGAGSLTGAIVCLVAVSPMIAIYCQNECVNRKSLPLVMKQPVQNDLQTLNALYEVTQAEFEMIAVRLSTYDRGVGFIRCTGALGKVRFQVFHPAAFALMEKAKRTSRWLLGFYLFVAVYNIFFIVLYSVIIKK